MPLNHGGGVKLVRDGQASAADDEERVWTFAVYGLEGPYLRADGQNGAVPLTVDLKAARVRRIGPDGEPQPALVPDISAATMTALRQSHKPNALGADVDFRLQDELVFYDRLVKPPSKAFDKGSLDEQLSAIRAGGLPGTGVTDSHPAAYTYFGQFIAHDLTHMVWDPEAEDAENPGGPKGAWVNKAAATLTSLLASANGRAMPTRCCGLSLTERPGSASGEPIRNSPTGTTTIAGPSPLRSLKSSLNRSPGW